MNTSAETQPSTQELKATTLHERIDLICGMIPDTFDGKENVLKELKGRQESIAYTAPEAIDVRWREVSTILSNHLPDPKSEDWPKEIAELFCKPIET
ncbi:MAG: hypothetical protein ACI9H6_000587 [Patiriisocius sp.]|jgi:hypothetical protein